MREGCFTVKDTIKTAWHINNVQPEIYTVTPAQSLIFNLCSMTKGHCYAIENVKKLTLPPEFKGYWSFLMTSNVTWLAVSLKVIEDQLYGYVSNSRCDESKEHQTSQSYVEPYIDWMISCTIVFVKWQGQMNCETNAYFVYLTFVTIFMFLWIQQKYWMKCYSF